FADGAEGGRTVPPAVPDGRFRRRAREAHGRPKPPLEDPRPAAGARPKGRLDRSGPVVDGNVPRQAVRALRGTYVRTRDVRGRPPRGDHAAREAPPFEAGPGGAVRGVLARQRLHGTQRP